MADVLKTAEVGNPANSVFVEHSHLQDAGVGCKGGCALCFDISPMPYGKGMVRMMRLPSHFVLRFVGIVSCLGQMKGRHLVISGLSRIRTGRVAEAMQNQGTLR